MASQKFNHLACIGDMFFHPQRQRFHTLQNRKGIVWAHHCTEIAQAFAARAQGESCNGRFLRKNHSMKAIVRFAKLAKMAGFFVCLLPVKNTAVYQQSSDCRPMTTQEFGGGMHNQIRAMIERAQ